MEQLIFKFPIKSEYLSEDFIVTSANMQAFTYIQNWPNWTGGIYAKMLLIYGDKGSGKTHLANIWKVISQAKIITIDKFNSINEKALILENIENIKSSESLFHLINSALENQQYLLLTSSLHPTKLPFTLPDLTSRILAIPSIAINHPDQELLKTILLKELSERHLHINTNAMEYLISRIERSYSKLVEFIEKIDKETQILKRQATIPLIKKILDADNI